MKMNKVSLAGLLATIGTVVVYWAINNRSFDQGIKWWLFGAHLTLAILGFIMGAWALTQRSWIGSIYLIACGYFIYIQLL